MQIVDIINDLKERHQLDVTEDSVKRFLDTYQIKIEELNDDIDFDAFCDRIASEIQQKGMMVPSTRNGKPDKRSAKGRTIKLVTQEEYVKSGLDQYLVAISQAANLVKKDTDEILAITEQVGQNVGEQVGRRAFHNIQRIPEIALETFAREAEEYQSNTAFFRETTEQLTNTILEAILPGETV